MTVDEIYAPIAGNLAALERQLQEVLHSDNPGIRDVNAYLLASSGKRVRPALFLLACSLWRNDPGFSLPVALAIEMIHTATLIHDDVVDDSALRRGRPSLNAIFGNHTAVLSGDYLFAQAFSLLTGFGSLPIIRELAQVVKEMSEGEIIQQTERFNPFLTEETYFKLIKKKTACFFAACGACGGIAAGAAADQVQVLKNYGNYIGMAFQVIDDMIDFYADEERAGKPCLADLKSGVFTLPLIHLLNTSPDASEFRNRLAGGEINDRLVSDIRAGMESCGSLAYAGKIAEQYVKKAVSLALALPAGQPRDHLVRFGRFILERNC